MVVTPKASFQNKPVFMARSLGCHMLGAVPPVPSVSNRETFFGGVLKRVGAVLPPFQPKYKRLFRSWWRIFLKKNFKPLDPRTDVSLENWLKHANNYTLARKQELRDAYKPVLRKSDYKVNSFGKTEFLGKYKELRIINSRCDAFKAFTGPIFHQIEQSVFRTKYFAKFVPVEGRMAYLIKRLQVGGRRYASTDYTSFESHMTPEIMKMIEFQLYAHMTNGLPEGTRRPFMHHVTRALSGTQRCHSKFGSFRIDGTRMSGDMCTSLGNGITNLALTFFALYQLGATEVDGVFEGDDGVISHNLKYDPTPKDFEPFGANIKFVPHPTVGDAEFCSFIADDTVGDNLADPGEVLSKVGWSLSLQRHGGPKIMKQLARAKGFSLVYQYPRCPVLRACGEWLLRSTEGVNPLYASSNGRMDWWDQQVLWGMRERLPNGTIADPSRRKFADKFHMSIDQQVNWERMFDSMNQLSTFPMLPGLELPDESYLHNYQHNVVVLDSGASNRLMMWR